MTVEEITAALKVAASLIPVAMELGHDIGPFYETLKAIASGTALTPAQRADLDLVFEETNAAIEGSED